MIYTWKLKSLQKTNFGDLQNVVVQTSWEIKGTDEEGNSGTFNGATPFKIPTGENFTAYEDLTEEIVLGWIKDQVIGKYKDHIDEKIQEQIDQKKNVIQEVKEEELPWFTSGPTPEEVQ
jgi:hypothetical protein